MRDVIIISGLHTDGSKGGMVDLARELRKKGLKVRIYPYPTRWAFMIYSKRIRRYDAEGLLAYCKNDGSEVIISHSNGSLVTQDAMQLGLRTHGWISFGGAATSDKIDYKDYNFKWAISVFNPHDVALWFGAKLPWHPFGRLGSEGYRGSPSGFDKRWMNVNGASKRWGLNHSHYTTTQLTQWSQFCFRNVYRGHSQLSIER